MLSSIKIRGMVASVIALALLPLFIFLFGCGGNDDSEQVSTWTTEETTASTTETVASTSDVVVTPETPEPVVVVSEPEPPREVTFEDAETAYHERRYAEAEEMFTLYTESRSENPWGFYMLGLSAWKAGNHESAEQALQRALELDSLHVKSSLNLARVLLDVGRSEEALVPIRQVISLEPESNDAYRLKGRVYHQIGQKPQAVDAYRRAIEIDNEDVWSMNNLALVLIEEGHYCEALPPLARAVELKSDNASFFNNLGMALEHMGHFRAAEQAYRSAVEVDDTYEKASLNLARIEVVLEDPGLEPIDLTAVARSFVEELQGEMVSELEETEPIEPQMDSFAVSDADSTGSSEEQ